MPRATRGPVRKHRMAIPCGHWDEDLTDELVGVGCRSATGTTREPQVLVLFAPSLGLRATTRSLGGRRAFRRMSGRPR